MRLTFLAVLLLALAGCAAPSASPGSTPAPTHTPPLTAPETLYLKDTSGGVSNGTLEPTPDAQPMYGMGAVIDGGSCPGTGKPPVLDECWSEIFAGPAQAAHAAGDRFVLHLWLEPLRPVPREAVVHALLLAGDAEVADANATAPMLLGPPATGPTGANGCVELVAAGTFHRGVAAGDPLLLDARVENVVGNRCPGGGEQGSRIGLGL